jgi:hypothetical protein
LHGVIYRSDREAAFSGPHKLILTMTKMQPLCTRSEQSNDAKEIASNGVPNDKQDIGGLVG